MPAAFERYRALTVKEFQQLRRHKRLLVQLVIPPTAVLIIFGFALNPEVKHLRTGVVDASRTPESRDLISALTEFEAFQIAAYYGSASDVEGALRRSELDLGIILPSDFARSLAQGQVPRLQVLVDAVNANSAAITRGYLAQALADYNRRLRVTDRGTESTASDLSLATAQLTAQSVVLYNPGLVYPWFFVTGVMGVLIYLNGALVASALTVREKELGTIEQLLMSPAQTVEMLLAKTVPVLLLLIGDLLVALLAAHLVFGLPVRGSILVLLLSGVAAALAGTGIGIVLATYSNTQQQAQLLTFFMLPPMVLLSGAFSPIESMPPWLQYLSFVDPLRYLLVLIRGITLKGAGLDMLWRPLLILSGFAVALYGLSAWRFRKQLG